MRRRWALLVAPLAWIALSIGPATADCSGASIEIRPSTASPGEAITVEGTAFAFCDDTSGPCEAIEITATYETATVFLAGGGASERAELGTAAIDDGAFTIETTVPDLDPGVYEIDVQVDGGSFDAHADPFRITAG
jgi:hypothetical protein